MAQSGPERPYALATPRSPDTRDLFRPAPETRQSVPVDQCERSHKPMWMLLISCLPQAHLPYVEDFLEYYLKTWNGVDHTDLILELLTYTKPTSYERKQLKHDDLVLPFPSG